MHRSTVAPHPPRFTPGISAWLARRWYYTPRTHRAYSVRQISPGDRRLLAEFINGLGQGVREGERDDLNLLTRVLLDRVIATGNDESVGFAALENTSMGDRVIGVTAYAATGAQPTVFTIAVANSFREQQVGRTLLSTLLRHAKRVGVPRLEGEMALSNRAMQMLAMSMGFRIEPAPHDRSRRLLVLPLR